MGGAFCSPLKEGRRKKKSSCVAGNRPADPSIPSGRWKTDKLTPGRKKATLMRLQGLDAVRRISADTSGWERNARQLFCHITSRDSDKHAPPRTCQLDTNRNLPRQYVLKRCCSTYRPPRVSKRDGCPQTLSINPSSIPDVYIQPWPSTRS